MASVIAGVIAGYKLRAIVIGSTLNRFLIDQAAPQHRCDIACIRAPGVPVQAKQVRPAAHLTTAVL